MNREEARKILTDLTKTESLLRHARSVEVVMEHYAKRYPGEDPEEWAIAGLLHDADYEAYPDKHPNLIVEKLREVGEEKIAHAISAHYTKWGVSYDTLLDKALLACDEITGFIIACAWLRPTKLQGLKSKSVMKKFKTKTFAAKVEREEVLAGVEFLGVDIKEHIDFIISVLQQYEEELGLKPEEQMNNE